MLGGEVQNAELESVPSGRHLAAQRLVVARVIGKIADDCGRSRLAGLFQPSAGGMGPRSHCLASLGHPPHVAERAPSTTRFSSWLAVTAIIASFASSAA